MRGTVAFLLLVAFPAVACAQGQQCRTSPNGADTPYCSSEAFVTQHFPASSIAGHVATFANSSGQELQDGGAAATGTVTEQKNTFGYGLTPSGNCDNTSTNAASPCNAVVNLSSITNSLSSNIALNNTSTYFDGPGVAQGTIGTWWASGTVTLNDTAAASHINCKLWDGTTVIASSSQEVEGNSHTTTMALSGYLAAPAANIKISCEDVTTTTGQIVFNATGNSKDSTLSAHRIQ